MTTPCPRCGKPVPPRKPGRGRPPVWCSQDCRRAASSERRAAAARGEPVRVVEVAKPAPLDDAVAQVLASPRAVENLLIQHAEAIRERREPSHATGRLESAAMQLQQAWAMRRTISAGR